MSNETEHHLADVEAFLETLKACGLFVDGAELYITRAPGRLDVMGGIADYSGSLVLQLPLREAALVALQKTDSRELSIVSLTGDENRRRTFHMRLEDFERDGEPIRYAEARELFSREPRCSWAAYVAGAFLVLMRERGARFRQGARILIDSQVPEGKGVSSSAAIEVAVFSAVVAAWDIPVEPRDLALLCQKVENEVVGAPCGVMDQMTATCGEADRLLALLCQPAELRPMRSMPPELAVWGIDSGLRHSVGGGDYGMVRTGAFMGYRIIAGLAGLEVEKTDVSGLVRIDDPRWRGYLANVTPTEFEELYSPYLPERIAGAEFLSRYDGITDGVTRVQPGKMYAVRQPTAHPIYEHARVCRFAELLSPPVSDAAMRELGALMYASHASYSACGLGSAGTDLLVELVREAGEREGLYGAKITGGGSGGTVAVLGRRGADAAIARLAAEYARRTGHHPHLFSGSSPGAVAFGKEVWRV